MIAFLDGFFDRLADYSGQPWFYAVIVGVALLDSVVPIVPSETVVILGGIAAGQHDLNIGFVIAAAAGGALLGDNLAYGIGRRFSARITRWYDRTPKRARKLAWAEHQLRTRGGTLLLTARFIPGGRTIITLTSGITRQKRWKFILFDLFACGIWAGYSAGLGYFFGNTFEGDHTTAFLVAFGTALTITALVEIVRHRRTKRKAASAAPIS